MSNHCPGGRFSALWIAGSLAISMLLAAAPLRAANYSWAVSSGNWSIASNWGGIVPTINDSGILVNGGTATVTTLGTAYNSLDIDGGSTLQMLSGSMQAGTFVQNGGSLYVGNASSGNFVQSGGTVQIYQYLSAGLRIANQAGSVGNYTMTGNSLLSLGDDGGYGANVNVGYSGTGTFTQSSGTVSIYDDNGGDLTLGAAAGGVGYYSLSGSGLLSVHGDALPGSETVGASGPGTFTQSGGTNSTDGGINVGSGAIGSYTLSHGYLSASSMSIGVSSSGTFTQNGGASSISNSLTLGTNSGGYGSYTLSAGTLSGPNETIGNGSTAAGLFLQTGGLNNAASLTIASSGAYLLHGGTLQVVGDLTNLGLLDGGNTAAVLSIVGSSIDDFSQGTLQNCASTTVTAGPFSLMNFPAGFNPSTAFAAYSTQGLTHIVGSTLVVPAGRGFMGSITLNDPVTCQGSMIASSGNINLNNGLSMSGTAAVALGNGNLIVSDTTSGMSGTSTLSLQSLSVGSSGGGAFTQAGGNSAISGLTLGAGAGGNGTYVLSDGHFSTIGETIGNSGTGAFTQSGGYNTISSTEVTFTLGNNPGSFGSYTLSGTGQLSMQAVALGTFERVGISGVGIFTQTGGTNAGATVALAANSDSFGTYNLNGGLLSIGGLTQGSGSAAFNFSGGTLQSAGGFTLSVPTTIGGATTFDTDGNSLAIVAYLSGTGSLTKINAGTLTLQSVNAYSGGTNINGGVLVASVGATLGSGGVNVTGGTLDVTQNALTVSSINVGAAGAVNLSVGNILTVSGTAAFGGTLNIQGAASGSPSDLMNYAGHSGSFANAPLPFGYALQYNPTQLDLVAAYSSIGVWAAAQSGSWATPANWTEGAVPSGRGAGVEINAPSSGPLVITLDGQQTVGTLVLGNSASATAGYTISAGNSGSLTLDNSGSVATIVVANGAHGITAPVVLAAGLVVTPSAGATLAISGNISQTGPSGVSVNGPGLLILSGSNTYTGPTTVSAGTLEIGGGGNGAPGNITLNSTGTGSITLSGSIKNAGTITNAGSGSGGATISGTIGPNVTGVVQNSPTSPLTLSGSNTWTGGLAIQAGTVTGTGTGSGAFGGGTIYLGNTSGSGSATLAVNITGGSIVTYANPITVQAGSSGLLSILDVPASAHSVVFIGPVALDNNLTVGSVYAITFSNAITEDGNPHTITGGTGTIGLNSITVGAGGLTLTNAGATLLSASGGIGGTGNLVLNNNTATADAVTLATAAVNNAGTITNSGNGSGSVRISAPIGANVTGLIQSSASSLLVLSNSNNSSGGIAISAGTVEINTSGSVNSLGSGTLTIGDPTSTGAAAAIQFTGGSSNFPTFTNTINVTGTGPALLYATSWNPIFSGPLVLSNNLTIGSNNASASTLTFNGGVSGTGNITVSIDNTSNGSYVSFGTAAVNNSGTLTFNNASFNGGPAGTGDGTNTISGGIGSNVTAITEASNVNPLVISTNPLSVNGGGTTLISSGSALFTVSGGVNGTGNLVLQNNSRAAAGITLATSVVNNSGTITNSGTGSGGVTISAAIGANVTGIVENSSSSVLTLSGSNTFTGNTVISSGTLQVGSGGSGEYLASQSISNSGTLVFNHSDALSYTGVISGNGVLAKIGSGTLTLSGSNTYSGGTMIAGGATAAGGTPNGLMILNAAALGTGPIVVGDQVGAGEPALILGNGVNLSGQALTLASSASTGGRGNLATVSGGTASYSGLITLSGDGVTGLYNNGGLTVSGAISGSGSNFLLRGTGTGILESTLNIGATPVGKTDVGGWTISSTGNVWGATTVSVGTLKLGANNALPTATVVTMGEGDGNDATWDLNGFSQTVGGLALNTDGGIKEITNNGAAVSMLTVSGTANSTYGGRLSDGTSTLSLVKTGPGAFTLTGNQTFSGGTTVSGGTLAADDGNTATGGLGGGNVTVNNGAVITVGGDNSFVGNATSGARTITINAGGLVSMGGNSDHLNALVMNGGTLSATTAETPYGNWNFDYGVTTLGNSNTSTISGGNAALTEAGGTIFNVLAGDTLIVASVLAHTSSAGDTGLIKQGAGLLTLTNSLNSFTGNLTVSGGTLVATASNNQVSATATALGNVDLPGRSIIVNNGGMLLFNAGNVLNGAGGSANVVYTPITIGAGGTVVSGSEDDNMIGPVNLSGGTLLAGTGPGSNYYSWILSPSGTITVSNSPSVMAGNGTSYSGFMLAVSSTFNVAPTGGPGYDLTVSAPLSNRAGSLGVGGLVKIGSGSMLLSASNNYTGPTTVNQGMLAVDGSLANSAVSVNGGTLGGTGFLGNVTVNTGGNLAPGDSLGTLAVIGSLVLESGARTDFELDTPATSSMINVGDLALNGQQFSDFSFTWTSNFGPGNYNLVDFISSSGSLGTITNGTIDGYPATLAVQGDDLVLNVTPEPGTLALLAVGAIGLAGYGLWRRRAMRRTAKRAAFDQQGDPPVLSFPSHSSQPANVARRAA